MPSCKTSIRLTFREPMPLCPKCHSNAKVQQIVKDFINLSEDQPTHYCSACQESFQSPELFGEEDRCYET